MQLNPATEPTAAGQDISQTWASAYPYDSQTPWEAQIPPLSYPIHIFTY